MVLEGLGFTNLEVKQKGSIHLRLSELSPVFSQLELVFQPIKHLYEGLHRKSVATFLIAVAVADGVFLRCN